MKISMGPQPCHEVFLNLEFSRLNIFEDVDLDKARSFTILGLEEGKQNL